MKSLSFFDFCAKINQRLFGPEHDQLNLFFCPLDKSPTSYFESSKEKSHWHQELQSVSVQYNNFFNDQA
jgi:hypothetical protein